MTNKRYNAGRSFEYLVFHDLENRGYSAFRSAGSHSKVDLIAVKGDISLLIQCKTDGAISPVEWNTLYNLCQSPYRLPIVALKGDGRISYRLITAPRSHRRREWEPFDPGGLHD